MGKKNKGPQVCGKPHHLMFARNIPIKDRDLFSHAFRKPTCLYKHSWDLLEIKKLNPQYIKTTLALGCKSIEHQIIKLRTLTQLSREDYLKRLAFTQNFLTCLRNHHNIVYQGILFGSTVNGLGFCDSDVDLRLRPLRQIEHDFYEPYAFDEDMVDRALRNVAHQTTRCSPALGEFVPSTRCPVAKLTFVREPKLTHFSKFPDTKDLQEGLKFDISLGSETPLGIFNSLFLRFLCNLEPKFHLLATVIRYWSTVHQLIVPGYLSSYALVNMLIFFCQTTQPPLLPTVDEMRDLYFKKLELDKLSNTNSNKHNGTDMKTKDNSSHQQNESDYPKALTQIEWQCIICLDKSYYKKSENKELLSVLLLKFFEYYLKFPYSTHILTTRPGRPLSHQEFLNSTQYHPRFPINQFLSIQDPFDARHNLTSGIQGGHLQLVLKTMKASYEIMYGQLTHNFLQPRFGSEIFDKFDQINYDNMPKNQQQAAYQQDIRDWGLNCLFIKLKADNQNSPKKKGNQNKIQRNGSTSGEKQTIADQKS